MIYAIRAEGTKRIKIGRAIDPASRLRELQTGNGYRLSLLLVLPGDAREEAYLHQRFAEWRTEGEWFDFPDDGVPEVAAELILNAYAPPWGKVLYAREIEHECPVCGGRMIYIRRQDLFHCLSTWRRGCDFEMRNDIATGRRRYTYPSIDFREYA